MRRWKIPLTALLLLVVLFDGVVGVHVWKSGWPKHVSVIDGEPGVAEIQVTPIAFSGVDWLLLVLILLPVVAIHAVLINAVWESWHPMPLRS